MTHALAERIHVATPPTPGESPPGEPRDQPPKPRYVLRTSAATDRVIRELLDRANNTRGGVGPRISADHLLGAAARLASRDPTAMRWAVRRALARPKEGRPSHQAWRTTPATTALLTGMRATAREQFGPLVLPDKNGRNRAVALPGDAVIAAALDLAQAAGFKELMREINALRT